MIKTRRGVKCRCVFYRHLPSIQFLSSHSIQLLFFPFFQPASGLGWYLPWMANQTFSRDFGELCLELLLPPRLTGHQLSRACRSISSSPRSRMLNRTILWPLPVETPKWGAADTEIKVPSARNTELKAVPLKPAVGQYIAIHATLTARDFFIANFCPSGPFTCIFFQNLSRLFFLC